MESEYSKTKITYQISGGVLTIKDVSDSGRSNSDIYINFIKSAYKLYEKQLFENNIVDFSYLQVEFLNMLLKNKEFLEKINNDFDYIMVD